MAIATGLRMFGILNLRVKSALFADIRCFISLHVMDIKISLCLVGTSMYFSGGKSFFLK